MEKRTLLTSREEWFSKQWTGMVNQCLSGQLVQLSGYKEWLREKQQDGVEGAKEW